MRSFQGLEGLESEPCKFEDLSNKKLNWDERTTVKHWIHQRFTIQAKKEELSNKDDDVTHNILDEWRCTLQKRVAEMETPWKIPLTIKKSPDFQLPC